MGYILHLKEEKILSPQSLGISTAALKTLLWYEWCHS